MPELPDVTVYVERLRALACSQHLLAMRVQSPFLLRTVDPAPDAFVGRALQDVRRIGKRIVMGFEGEHYAAIHLMIAGRLRWTPVAPGAAAHPNRSAIATFDFPSGSLFMTEAGTKHRASLHLVRGRDQLAAFDRGGVSVFEDSPAAFGAALCRENRTIKRALTDPSIVDGVGNAYSDESCTGRASRPSR